MSFIDAVTRQRHDRSAVALGIAGAVVVTVGAAWLWHRGFATAQRFEVLAVLLLAAAVVVVVWFTDPAYTLAGALCLTAFSGHWDDLGLPSLIVPDRFLLVLVIAAVLFRAPGARDRPDIVLGAPHALLALAALFAVCSAAISGTLVDHLGTFRLVDRFGLLPFAAFVIAPVIYRTQRQRAVLIATLVGLGAYLSLTALFQMAGVPALVFPKYILDPGLEVHFGRARGPFVNAAVNGIALYACAIACFMAAVWSRRPWLRRAAVPVGALCTISLLFTLQRSIWIGAGITAVVTFLAVRELRRLLPIVLLLTVAAVGASLAVLPGFAAKVTERKADIDTVIGRQNLNAAALSMLEERPLVGFGWATYERNLASHLELPADRVVRIRGTPPAHNLLLSNLAELGLVGTSLWLLALALAIAGALRGPPLAAARPWRIMLLSVAGLYALVAMASPLEGQFQHMLLWLLAGVVGGMALPERRAALEQEAPC